MTMATRLFGHALIAPADLNRLVKAAEREVIRMPKAVRGFRVIFSDCIGRRMTVVTGGDGVMARFLPAVVLLLHYVAISAVSRIVAHIRIAFGIDERINGDTDRQPDADSENREFNSLQSHFFKENRFAISTNLNCRKNRFEYKIYKIFIQITR